MTTTAPNILIVMSDEHSPRFAGFHGHPVVQTPHLDRLAAAGVVFDAAYCNSPLCVPSRMSFMTGRHIHEIAAYDNASPLPSDVPTWAHALRASGYDVVLAGKQHFVGADQLHGFQSQLATDIHGNMNHPLYLWDDGVKPSPTPWAQLSSSGPGVTEEIETDDRVEQAALDFIHGRTESTTPWALNVGFIAPHFPFVAPAEYWDLFEPSEIDMPSIPPDHMDAQHPVYARLRQVFGIDDVSEAQVRRARHGYYALIAYLDAKVGRLLGALEETGQADNTIVVYTSDHGEMNGEHGLWRKSNFYEDSVRVPLVMRWPGELPEGRRIRSCVSLVDLTATIVDAAGGVAPDSLDGRSVMQLARGDEPAADGVVFSSYLAHGVTAPMAMIRRGPYKLVSFHGEGIELYDVEADPGELQDLAGEARLATVVSELSGLLDSMWHVDEVDAAVRRSQYNRRLIRVVAGTQDDW